MRLSKSVNRRTDNTIAKEGQTTQWPKRRTDNTMAKTRRTDNTMVKRRTDNTMAKRRRTDNIMAKRRTDNTMAKRRRTDNTMAKRRKDNDLQNTTQKTKDRATRTQLKSGDELSCSGRVSSSCSTRNVLIFLTLLHLTHDNRSFLSLSRFFPHVVVLLK